MKLRPFNSLNYIIQTSTRTTDRPPSVSTTATLGCRQVDLEYRCLSDHSDEMQRDHTTQY